MKAKSIALFNALSRLSKMCVILTALIILYTIGTMLVSFTGTLRQAYIEYKDRQDIVTKDNEIKAKVKAMQQQQQTNLKLIQQAKKDNGLIDTCIKKQKYGTHQGFIPCGQPTQSAITKASADEVETIVPTRDQILMQRICSKSYSDKLCNNWELYNGIKDYATSMGMQDIGIILGISDHESKFGTDFARKVNGVVVHDDGTCAKSNNWAGMKQLVDSTGKVTTKSKYPDSNGCYLANFESPLDSYKNLINMIQKNYMEAGCNKRDRPIACISLNYVGKPGVEEPNWINTVAKLAY